MTQRKTPEEIAAKLVGYDSEIGNDANLRILREQVERAIQKERQASGQWVSVEERLPENCDDVAVLVETQFSGLKPKVAYYHADLSLWMDAMWKMWNQIKGVQFWYTLPPLPSDGGAEGEEEGP